MRLMIAIPTGDRVRFEFCESLANLCKSLAENGIDFDVRFHEGSAVYMARETLAVAAIDEGYTHVLWLDSDMGFVPDLFYILRNMGKPFVTCIYRSRRPPYMICLFDNLTLGTRFQEVPDKEFEVDGCGFGVVLMETKVLADIHRKFHTIFEPFDGLGEDMACCKRYRMMGGSIWSSPDAVADHGCNVLLRAGDVSNLLNYTQMR